MTTAAGSITRLIPPLRERDGPAIEQLWQRYVARMHRAARPVISGLAPGAGDEEDVAQSAFQSFCEAAAAGRLPDMAGRNELWRLLVTFTQRKAVDRVRRETRRRRGGGVAIKDRGAVDELCDAAPDPVEIVELQEALDELFSRLAAHGDERLADVARLRMEGLANGDIAQRLSCAVRTVQRKLLILERLWTAGA
jgi:DNA-directed RNA polymerase specialized sigma24 family protein